MEKGSVQTGKRVLLGVLVSLSMYLLLLALLAWLTLSEQVGEKNGEYLVWVGAAAAVFCGVLCAARRTEKKQRAAAWLVWLLFCAAVWTLGTVLLEEIEGERALALFLAGGAGAALALLPMLRRGKGKRRHRAPTRSRR